jgi:hypothetical protein
VRNLSDSETAVIAILGTDFKSYPTLGPSRNANVTTEIGGNYTVTVVMSTIDAQTYRSNLQTLKKNVQQIVDGSASNDERLKYFAYLAGINSAISQAQAAGGASCSGKITLDESKPTNVSVSVSWISNLGSGYWQLSCDSA